MNVDHLRPGATRIFSKFPMSLYVVVAEVNGRPEIYDTARGYQFLKFPVDGCEVYEIERGVYWWAMQ